MRSLQKIDHQKKTRAPLAGGHAGKRNVGNMKLITFNATRKAAVASEAENKRECERCQELELELHAEKRANELLRTQQMRLTHTGKDA